MSPLLIAVISRRIQRLPQMAQHLLCGSHLLSQIPIRLIRRFRESEDRRMLLAKRSVCHADFLKWVPGARIGARHSQHNQILEHLLRYPEDLLT